jgi:hypothetical protein
MNLTLVFELPNNDLDSDLALLALESIPIDLDNCWSNMTMIYNWAVQYGIPIYQAFCQ